MLVQISRNVVWFAYESYEKAQPDGIAAIRAAFAAAKANDAEERLSVDRNLKKLTEAAKRSAISGERQAV